MAPEVADVMNPGGYSCAVDIWSAVSTPVRFVHPAKTVPHQLCSLSQQPLCVQGILLWFMLTGTIPFDPSSPQEMADRRKDLQTGVLEMETWKHISGTRAICMEFMLSNSNSHRYAADAKDLVCRMLCYDCDDRIAPIEIINHPWITKNCTARPDLARLMSESHMLSANSPVQVCLCAISLVCQPLLCVCLICCNPKLQEEYDLHNGVLTGLGVVTIDAAKLSGADILLCSVFPESFINPSPTVIAAKRTPRSGSAEFRTMWLQTEVEQQVRIYDRSLSRSVRLYRLQCEPSQVGYLSYSLRNMYCKW